MRIQYVTSAIATLRYVGDFWGELPVNFEDYRFRFFYKSNGEFEIKFTHLLVGDVKFLMKITSNGLEVINCDSNLILLQYKLIRITEKQLIIILDFKIILGEENEAHYSLVANIKNFRDLNNKRIIECIY